MHPKARSLALVTITIVASCTEVAPATNVQPPPPLLSLIATDTVRLPVMVTADSTSPDGHYVRLRALINDPNSSGPWSYHWYKRSCPGNVADYDCDDYMAFGDSTQSVSFTIPYNKYGEKENIVLEVREALPGGRSGADSLLYIMPSTAGYTISKSLKCALPTLNPIYYPWVEWKWNTDSAKYVQTTSYYRRNPCTGTKEWQ